MQTIERKLSVKDVRFIDEIHLMHLVIENEVEPGIKERTDFIGQTMNRLDKQWL